ncbi:MAG: hypothetical protein ACOX4R_07685 [Lentihominibacter sp.]|jgi:hypothetical protein
MKTRVKAKALALVMAVMMVFAMAPGMVFAADQAGASDPTAPAASDSTAPTVSENEDGTETPSNDEVLTDDEADKEQIAPQPVTAPAKKKRAPNAKVTMTVNDKGVIAKTRQGGPMANKTVTVRDLNRDGKLSVDEACIAAHKAYNKYNKRAKRSGYVSSNTEFGRAINKFWGKANGINYLTYINDKGIWNLDDAVKKGDHIYVSILADPGGNDWYTKFDQKSKTLLASTEFTLNLSGFYGAAFKPEDLELKPVADIQIGTWKKGKFTPLEGVKTDEDGNVKLKFTKAGTYYVTARDFVEGKDWQGKPVDCPTMAPMCVVKAKAAPNAKITMTVNNKGVIAKAKKNRPMALRTVTVRDLDRDGRLTVDEACIAAHKAYNKYNKKSAKRSGYVSSDTEFGRAINKFWGKDNGINYLTFVNHKGIWNLDDAVKKGDHIYVSILADPGGNDWYTFFDKTNVRVKRNREFTLNLSGFYGAAFKPEDLEPKPVADIQVGTWSKGKFKVIKKAKTDANGNVKLKFKKRGTYYVTARGTVPGADWEGKLVNCPTMAPACKVRVTR